jgi:hypothetical protein
MDMNAYPRASKLSLPGVLPSSKLSFPGANLFKSMALIRVFGSNDASAVHEIFAAAHRSYDASYVQKFVKRQLRVDLNDITE